MLLECVKVIEFLICGYSNVGTCERSTFVFEIRRPQNLDEIFCESVSRVFFSCCICLPKIQLRKQSDLKDLEKLYWGWHLKTSFEKF